MRRIKFSEPNAQKQKNIHYIRQYREIPTDAAVLASIIDSQQCTQTNEYEEEIKQDIVDRILHECETLLTEHQLAVLKMWMQGKTQSAIADELGIQQTSVNKAIHGVVTYDEKGNKVVFGGFLKKIRLWAEKDPVIKEMFTALQGGLCEQ